MKRSLWLVIALGGLGLYWLGSCHGRSRIQEEAALERAHAVLQTREAYVDSLSRLGRLLDQFQDSAHHLKQRIGQQRQLSAQLDTALTRAGNVRDSLKIALRQVVVLRGQVDALQQENLDLQTAMALVTAQRDLAEDRVDSLEAHLKETLTVAECHWDLGLIHPKCPSRTTVGLVGLGTGMVAALLLSK